MGHRPKPETDALPVGTRIGSYRVTKPLRSGGIATLYEAVDVISGLSVALKVLHAHLRADANARAMLRMELRVSQRVRHRGAVPVLGVTQHEGAPVLALALLEGIDLAQHLRATGALPVVEALALTVAALEVLAEVHEAGVVHGDIKPSNLFLLSDTRELRVLDFGVARLRDDVALPPTADLPSAHDGFGTPEYMPLEQMERAGRVEPRSDLFSVGVTLYECLTGRRPYHADTPDALVAALRAGHYAPVRTLRPDVPPRVEEVLSRALRPAPEERYDNAESMAGALREVLDALRAHAIDPAAPAMLVESDTPSTPP